ncbi:hypothetical protein [Niabella aquatica]
MNRHITTAFLFILVLVTTSCGTFTHEKFNSEKWKHSNFASEETISLRWDMMNDLRNRYHLEGMTRQEIIDLLGNPDSDDNTEISYFLGYSKKGINTGSLTLTFNDNGAVAKVYVYEG